MLKIGPVKCTHSTRSSRKWDDKFESKLLGFCVSYSDSTINALQFIYAETGGVVYSGSPSSHLGPSFKRVWFDPASEYLTSISGSYDVERDGVFTAITFGTNKAKYGPFGCTNAGEEDQTFSFDWGPYNDFRGSHGMFDERFDRLVALGVYLNRSPDLETTTDRGSKC